MVAEGFRGGLVCKAHRLLYLSTLDSGVIKKKKHSHSYRSLLSHRQEAPRPHIKEGERGRERQREGERGRERQREKERERERERESRYTHKQRDRSMHMWDGERGVPGRRI